MRGGRAIVYLLLCAAAPLRAEDGYDLWLRYQRISDGNRLAQYRATLTHIVFPGETPTLRAARSELSRGLNGLLATSIPQRPRVAMNAVIAGTPASFPAISRMGLRADLQRVGAEGFVIRNVVIGGNRAVVIAANTDTGVLYGVFALLRRLQMQAVVRELDMVDAPRIKLRMLDHWDNLNGTVERGYAGFSLWDWHKLPGYLSPRYTDYARANASIGVNATVLTNVNANAVVLTAAYLEKVAALAGVFRPYGIRVFLTARFSAPIEIGGLQSADPLDAAVRAWWQQKADEIYKLIPDFGGFLVKANSEGQPGPQDYKRSHAEGANMLAAAVAPHGGSVIWRAFVYSNEVPTDRIRQAYDEFHPLDGSFHENVFIQVKNGPLDFQPREPFHPLFGGMPGTPLALELQITKEYLGFATHLVYMAPYWKEVLDADTHARGAGSTVARIVDGSVDNHQHSAIAGVANTGTDRNWSGSTFGQANWYAFGRLAWNHQLSSEAIAEEWIRMTLSNDSDFVARTRTMMLRSREAVVDYMTPLGLTHLMASGHHYGPGPWVNDLRRADWNPVYFHRADTLAIGFDRTVTGSNAIGQYFQPVARRFASRDSVPDNLLLWFHRVGWQERMRSGRTLWHELVHHYNAGVDSVRALRRTWDSLSGRIDDERFNETRAFLKIQEEEAVWWRDACLLYFQTFARKPIPSQYEEPQHSLDYYRNKVSRYVPGHY